MFSTNLILNDQHANIQLSLMNYVHVHTVAKLVVESRNSDLLL